MALREHEPAPPSASAMPSMDEEQSSPPGLDDRLLISRFKPAEESVRPLVSVVIPTKNEAGNIPLLIDRLETLGDSVPLEVIFADDSDDDTAEVISRIVPHSSIRITLVQRAPEERVSGLGGAVVAGAKVASGTWICVMDADLQHPPERIQDLLNQALSTESDLVIASRYRERGSVGDFNLVRKGASRLSALSARVAFPRKLLHVTDPMSGFFLVRHSALDFDELKPRGFKILLEIMAKTPNLAISEIGFEFGKRNAGESKASLAEGMTYAAQLCRLRAGDEFLRFVKFILVGASGFIVNSVLIFLFTSMMGVHYLVSAIFASWGSTVWNFGLTEFWVFPDRSSARLRLTRFGLFFGMNSGLLIIREPLIWFMTSVLGIYYVASNIISLVALLLLRYGVADSLIWERAKRKNHAHGPFSYDIHGILSVKSEVWLPELERFLISGSIDQPSINVHVHRSGFEQVQDEGDGNRFVYNEGFGPLGFGINIRMGQTIDIKATPLLRHSPHVLYTNVVEPILRWTFTQKGYALVHGACIAFDDDAYLLTARTDTGKTTTILKILDRQRRESDTGSFLSDDLTLLSADGQVLTYPKPMTISRHTVAAVRTPLLSRFERITLFIQSRLHSREGRQFAFRLVETGLPVATINGFVQWIVPPPKYHVQRLVPHVRLLNAAHLHGIFVIERGEDGEVQLSDSAAIETLLTNSDDAYGFPPYSVIKKRLTQYYGPTLEEAEREIVTQALSGLPANLVRSSTMTWAQRIPELAGITNEPRVPLTTAAPASLAPAT
jgi:glycosyltransferase involved in cell wall biosynthesis